MYQGNRPGPFSLQALRQGQTPFTWVVIGANALTFFVIAALPTTTPWLAFVTEQWWLRPWTLLTWPLVAPHDVLSLLFSIGWMYLFGGSMERAWGTGVYVRFFTITSLLTAVTLWLGSLLVGPGFATGIFAAVGPTMIAWAFSNRGEVFQLFFIPLPPIVIAILGAVMTWFYAGAAYHNPLVGLFALSGCAVAWWYVTAGRAQLSRLRSGQPTAPNLRFADMDRELRDENKPSRNPLKRAKEERERKERDRKLEEMFRRSYRDDKD